MATEQVPKKLHWTQTPEGRERIAKILKAQYAAGTRKKRVAKKGAKQPKAVVKKPARVIVHAHTDSPKPKTHHAPKGPAIPSELIAYISGRFHAQLEQFAQSAGVSSDALAVELGKVLQSGLHR